MSNQSESHHFNDRDIIAFLRDFIYDSAEQTNALKKLADSFGKLADDGICKRDIDELRVQIEKCVDTIGVKIGTIIGMLKDIDKCYQKNTISKP